MAASGNRGDDDGRSPELIALGTPFDVVEVQTAAGGVIGLAQVLGLRGERFRWDYLEEDLDRVAEWGATAVLCLIENHEVPEANPDRMLFETHRRDMGFLHLPIPPRTMPDAAFDATWESLRDRLIRALGKGQRLVVQCTRGRDRCAMVAARLLIDSGMQADAAIRALRDACPDALSDPEHVENVRAYARRH